MEIGKEKAPVHIEPMTVPVPQRERTSPARQPDTPRPRRFDPIKPKAPVQDPNRAPVKVPAK